MAQQLGKAVEAATAPHQCAHFFPEMDPQTTIVLVGVYDSISRRAMLEALMAMQEVPRLYPTSTFLRPTFPVLVGR